MLAGVTTLHSGQGVLRVTGRKVSGQVGMGEARVGNREGKVCVEIKEV